MNKKELLNSLSSFWDWPKKSAVQLTKARHLLLPLLLPLSKMQVISSWQTQIRAITLTIASNAYI